MWSLGMIALGVIIGWQFPQPELAKQAQARIVAWVKAKWEQWRK